MQEYSSNDSLRRGELALTDQAGRAPSPLTATARAGAALMRGIQELGERLWSSLWLIVAVAVIMASLVVVAHLSLPFAVAAFPVHSWLSFRHSRADGRYVRSEVT